MTGSARAQDPPRDATHATARVVVHVAVGVLVRADGAVLLADRPPGKPYAGYWEFPGGKIEPGETVDQALRRELREELGIVIGPSYAWTVMEYDYPHAYVRLHFRRVFEWQGVPHPVEGQRLQFLAPGGRAPEPLLPAAVPALRWAALPTMTVQSPAQAADAAQALEWLRGVLERGARQILWHEPHIGAEGRIEAAKRCHALAQAYGARVIVDSRSGRDAELPCYLSAAALRATRNRPQAVVLAAGVRTQRDTKLAEALACEFTIFESTPRSEQASDVDPWFTKLAAVASHAGQPMYVARPPTPINLARALDAGAHGLLRTLEA